MILLRKNSRFNTLKDRQGKQKMHLIIFDDINALTYSFHISTYAKFTSTYRVHFMAIAYDFPFNLLESEIGASAYADDI